MLNLAARAAYRATGNVEPNPLVGCVIVRPGSGPARQRVVAIGHHRVFGGPHAEAEAISRASAAGLSLRGCTMYVTLEPCNAHGRNPPCVDAVIAAGIARVVCARQDTSPSKGGGAARLRAAGIEVEFSTVSSAATALAEPWAKRTATGLPWVIAKWAQSIDGRMTTPAGQSQWLTGPLARRGVHQLRARVDAILVGGGTVRSDNPMLTARDVHVRRVARPVVLTSRPLPPGSHLAQNPQAIVINPDTCGSLRGVLAMLARDYAVHTVLIEAGPRLLGAFLAGDQHGRLVDEMHVHTAPLLIGGGAPGPSDGVRTEALAAAQRWRLVSTRSRGVDVCSVYR